MNDYISIINKTVMSLYDCKDCGQINNLYFNKSYKCQYLSTRKDNLEYIISTKDIKSVEDSIVIGNTASTVLANCMDLTLSTLFKIISTRVFDTDGKYIGLISNIHIDNKYYISQIVLDTNITIPKSDIFNISKDLVIVQTTTKKSRGNYRPKKVPTPSSKHADIKVTALADTSALPEQNTTPTYNHNRLAISDTSMLYNRTISQNIIATNGELIARKDTIITKDIIRKARLYGKMYELIKYSR